MFGADNKVTSPSKPKQITKKPSAKSLKVQKPQTKRVEPIQPKQKSIQDKTPSPIKKVKIKKVQAKQGPQISQKTPSNQLHTQPSTMQAQSKVALPELKHKNIQTPAALKMKQPELREAPDHNEFEVDTSMVKDIHIEETPITHGDISFHQVAPSDTAPSVIETNKPKVLPDRGLRPAPRKSRIVGPADIIQSARVMPPKGVQPSELLPSALSPDVLTPSRVVKPYPMLPDKSIEEEFMPHTAGSKKVPGGDFGPAVIEEPSTSHLPSVDKTVSRSYPSSSYIDPSFAPVIPGSESVVASSVPMVPLVATVSWPSPESTYSDDYAQALPEETYDASASIQPRESKPITAIPKERRRTLAKTTPKKEKSSWIPVVAIAAGLGAVAYMIMQD